MRFIDFTKYLIKIEKADFPSAVILYGEQGIGKTYYIKKNLTSKNGTFIYFNLFNINSINSIYFELKKYISSEYISVKEGNVSINTSCISMKNNGYFVVFDEFDRRDDELKQNELFGLIHSLKNIGFNVILITDQLPEYNENSKSSKWIEKVFDSCFEINKIDNNVVESLLEANGLDFEVDIKTKNLRNLEKAISLYKDIVSDFEFNHNDICKFFDTKKSDFFIDCMIVISFIFSSSKYERDSDKYVSFKENERKYGTKCAEVIEKINKQNLEENIISIQYQICLYYFLRNYDRVYRINERKNKKTVERADYLSKNYFYLNEEERMKYLNIAKENIGNLNYHNPSRRNILNIFLDKSDKLPANIIETIACQMIKCYEDDLENIFEYEDETSSKKTDSINRETLKRELIEQIGNTIRSKLMSFNKRNGIDYKGLYEFLREHLKYHTYKSIILRFLVENDFFIGDLGGTLDYDHWRYCLFLAKNELTNNKFTEFLFKLKIGASSIIKERIESLESTSKYVEQVF